MSKTRAEAEAWMLASEPVSGVLAWDRNPATQEGKPESEKIAASPPSGSVQSPSTEKLAVTPVSLKAVPATLEELAACLEVWDQTVGCSHCGKADWGEDAAPPNQPYGWHDERCPLYGREDVAQVATFER